MNYFIVNTNIANTFADHNEMLIRRIVLANAESKVQLEKIKDGDVIFFHENTHGLIAYGWARGEIRSRTSPEDGNEIDIDGLTAISPPTRLAKFFKVLKAVNPIKSNEGISDLKNILNPQKGINSD